MQREAIQLMKDFTPKHVQDEVEVFMGMVVEEDQSFKGLIDHLCNAFKSGKMLSKLISNFYGWSQKAGVTKDAFINDLHVLAQKSFHINHHFIWRPITNWRPNTCTNYGTLTLQSWPTRLQSSPEEETFTKFWDTKLQCLEGMQDRANPLSHLRALTLKWIKSVT